MKACLTQTVRVQFLLLACCLLYSISASHCGNCPLGWQPGYNESVCLSILSNTNTWDDSETLCRAHGGHLASLNTEDEYQYVQAICSIEAPGGCWVGGQEEAQSRNGVLQWRWSNCHMSHDVDEPWIPKLFSNCANATICPNPQLPLMCTLVTSTMIVWDFCNSKHSYICSLGQERECKQKAAHKEYIIMLAVVSSLIFSTTMGVMTFLLAYRRSKRQRRSRRRKLRSPADATGLVLPAFRLYTMSELENATQHFSEANLLGDIRPEGGTYKGMLPDGTPVVVKMLHWSGPQSQKEFVQDMARIARLKHPNIVVVKGCCYESGKGIVVYEFVPNGALDKWLHNVPQGFRPLDWPERMRIATTVAQGIAFLHDKLKPHVVHRDIRASNVLLDDVFDAHILGVGLAKLVLREATQGHTVAAGTYGYLAPEFVYRNELTTKSDVYSFGVLLLELITGRKPTVEVETPDWQSLFEWATPLVQSQQFGELVDPAIFTIPDPSQVQGLVDLIYACTQHVPAMRPRMSYVVHQLQQWPNAVVPLTHNMNKNIWGDNISSLEISEVPL